MELTFFDLTGNNIDVEVPEQLGCCRGCVAMLRQLIYNEILHYGSKDEYLMSKIFNALKTSNNLDIFDFVKKKYDYWE